MEGPNWKLEDDNKTVRVTFPTNPTVALKLDFAGVEDLLKNLGEFRAHMTPEIPKTYVLGQKVGVISKPAWATEPDLMLENSLLHIRDPRYGWLHYLIPKDDARKLIGYLQKQVDAQPPEQQEGKPN